MATDSSSGAGWWTVAGSLSSSLVYYGVLASYTRTIVGGTSDAEAAVAAAFVSCTAVGALVNARAKGSRPYRGAELSLVIYCMSFPLLLPWLGEIYLAIAPSIAESSSLARNGARFAFSIIALCVPGYLVGITIASLSRSAQRARVVAWMLGAGALGTLASVHVLIPRLGLFGALAVATFVKLVLALVGQRPTDHVPDEPLRELEADPLPWRRILLAAAAIVVVFGAVFFRSILAFVLQNPIVLPGVLASILTLAFVARRGIETSSRTTLTFLALACGVLVYPLAAFSSSGGSVLLAAAAGAYVAQRVDPSRRWVGPVCVVTGAFVLITLATGAELPVALIAAAGLGAALSLAVRSAEPAGRLYAVCAGGAVVGLVVSPYFSLQLTGSLLVFVGGVAIAMLADVPKRRALAALALSAILWGPLLPLTRLTNESEPALEDDDALGEAARIASLLTPGRASALVTGGASSAQGTEGYESVISTGCRARTETCFRETTRSVLFETAMRFDVIVIGAPEPRELYQLAAKRLRRHGVVVQRLPLRRASPGQLFAIVNTASSVFTDVTLWRARDGALLVGSNEPQRVDVEALRSSSERDGFASGSPLELASNLIIGGEGMDDFLDALASLVDESRRHLVTDDRPLALTDEPNRLFELQAHAIFESFESRAPLGFRGAPTHEEALLARAAFSRGSIPALARAWSAGPSASLAASTWFFDTLNGRDASALSASIGDVARLTETLGTKPSCVPIPRFVSRLDRLRLSALESSSGESLDGTDPNDALDGTYDPFVGKGWRVRPRGRAVVLDAELASPAAIDVVHVVVRPIDEHVVETRLFGRDVDGRWRPLASDTASACEGARQFRLSAATPELTTLRITLHGDHPESGFALHELWAERQ